MRSLRVCSGVAALGLALATPASAEPARSADSFVDSIGVNVHMTYVDTAYADRARLVDELVKAGIRHVRDGLSWNTDYAYATFNALAAHGIHTTFIMGDPSEQRDTLDQLLTALRTKVRGAAEAVEGPNEYSYSGDPQWASRLRAYQQRLYAAIKGDPSLASLPVIAPSLITWQDYAALGDMTGAIDAGNKHSYPGGDIPEGNLDSELSTAARVSRNLPVWVTESGYHNALATTSGHRPASEAAAATYIPRMYLEYFRRGIVRTYAYELIDEWPDPARTNAEANFGLLRNDYSEKPAFRRLANLIAVLADPGPAFAPAQLNYTVAGAPADLHRLLLQKRDGSFYLVLWRAERVWDPVARTAVAAPAQNVTVRLDPDSMAGISGAQVIDPAVSTDPEATVGVAGGIPLTVGADPVIVRLAPGYSESATAVVQPPVPGTSGRVRISVPAGQRARSVVRRGLLVRCWGPRGAACRVTAARGRSVVAKGRRALRVSGSADVLARSTRVGKGVLRRAMRRHRRVRVLVRVSMAGRPARISAVVRP